MADRASTLIAIVSDGAGSATHSKSGSALTCRIISEAARKHFAECNSLPSDEQVWSWVDLARDAISFAAERRQLSKRDFAATLVAVIANDEETLVFHIGDGSAVVGLNGNWLVPSWPSNGEYASTTFFITDDPAPALRITRLPYSVDAVAAFSDGIERLLLQFTDQTAHSPKFDYLFSVLRSDPSLGRSRDLSHSLRGYLNSPAINERTDDDKSLVIATKL